MLLIECALILEQVKIPVWLLSRNTSYDVVSLLHRLYPAFMNGCRCIVGAFVIDHKNRRIEALTELGDSIRSITVKATSVIQGTERIAQAYIESDSTSENEGGLSLNSRRGMDSASMADALKSVTRNGNFDLIVSGIKQKAAMILDPVLLKKQEKSPNDYTWLRNTAIYLVARFILVKSNISGKKTAA